jgi:hypothetical protein
MFNLSRIPFEMLFVEVLFKINREFEVTNFVKYKSEFGKHSIPIVQLSNLNDCEISDEALIIERALLQFMNDVLSKTE